MARKRHSKHLSRVLAKHNDDYTNARVKGNAPEDGTYSCAILGANIGVQKDDDGVEIAFCCLQFEILDGASGGRKFDGDFMTTRGFDVANREETWYPGIEGIKTTAKILNGGDEVSDFEEALDLVETCANDEDFPGVLVEVRRKTDKKNRIQISRSVIDLLLDTDSIEEEEEAEALPPKKKKKRLKKGKKTKSKRRSQPLEVDEDDDEDLDEEDDSQDSSENGDR